MQLSAHSESPPSSLSVKLPRFSTIIVLAISILPSLLNLMGVDFGSNAPPFNPDIIGDLDPLELTDQLHRTLSGSFTHTILEWSAFCAALVTAVLAIAHFTIFRDVTTPVLGVALFCAGSMDAFHTLAADRLIEAVADNRDLIPFTWAICRLSNVVLTGLGVLLFLSDRARRWRRNASLVVAISAGLALLSYGVVHFCATSEILPKTTYPNALITRPWDVLPLVLFVVFGIWLYPRFYRTYPSLFSHALVVSTVPNAIVQLHMAFGSQALFDNHFNIAHFLKIVAYAVPLFGLILDYVYTHRHVAEVNRSLNSEVSERQKALASLNATQDELQEKNTTLQTAIAKLQTTQAQLVHTEKMSGLGRVVGGVAHEINNPLSFIYGNTIHLNDQFRDLLSLLDAYRLAFPEATPEIREISDRIEFEYLVEDIPYALNSMKNGAERIRALVVSLRNFSRLDESEIKVVNLHEGLDSTLILLEGQLRDRVQLVKQYGTLPPVECCPSELNQVWMNLISNAIDAVQENFMRENKATPQITIVTEALSKDRVRLSVMDNGCGMDEATRDRSFDPFFTTKPVGKGTGLGLSICDRIVEKHCGTISVRSRPGEGTTVAVTLAVTPFGRSH